MCVTRQRVSKVIKIIINPNIILWVDGNTALVSYFATTFFVFSRWNISSTSLCSRVRLNTFTASGIIIVPSPMFMHVCDRWFCRWSTETKPKSRTTCNWTSCSAQPNRAHGVRPHWGITPSGAYPGKLRGLKPLLKKFRKITSFSLKSIVLIGTSAEANNIF